MPLGRPSPPAARTPNAQRIVAALLGALVVGVLVALLSGWWAGGQTSAPPAASPDAPRPANAGPVRLEVTSDWVPVPHVPEVSGLPANTAAFTPAASLRAFAIVTLTPIDHPSLLPRALRDLMPAKLPEPKKTELLGAPAWRYGELPISDGRLLEVTVVPSTAGVVAVACIAPRESWVAALGCADDISGVTLPRNATWLPPAVDVAARARIPRAIATLDGRRVGLRAKLKAAKTRGGQARFAGRLAGAYAGAATAIADVTPATGPAADVVTGLKRTSAAYAKLAGAAAAGAPLRYKRAKQAAKAGEAKLETELAALGK